jgi:hypothetical protein
VLSESEPHVHLFSGAGKAEPHENDAAPVISKCCEVASGKVRLATMGLPLARKIRSLVQLF